VEREVLLLIDDHFAHGNLRDWASFTQTAAELCAAHGQATVDERVARNAFVLHGPRGGAGATRRGAAASERARPVTVWPEPMSSETMAGPVWPVPPVTNTCIALLEGWQRP